MPAFRATSYYIPLFAFLISNAFATFLTLSQFQQISGFSDTCCDAYNTPLTKCAQTDFEHGRSCSNNCIEQLEQVSTLLNTACKGTKAYPNTLIGMFFEAGSVGVSALCPTVQGSTGSVGGGSGNNGGDNGSNGGGNDGQSTQTTTFTAKATTKASASSTKAQTSNTQRTSSTKSAAASTTSSLVKSTISTTPAVANPTINSDATLTQSGLAGLRTTVVQASKSAASASSSQSASAQADHNNNGNSGGSGGTPFDISSSSCIAALPPSILAFMLGFGTLIYIV